MQTLYHISEDKNLKYLNKRIPRYAIKGEENTTIERICCSTDIYGCLVAISPILNDVLYVYKCLTNKNSVILNPKQILKDVSDAEFTNEHWILDKTIFVKLVGKVKILDSGNNISCKNSLGKKYLKNNTLKYEWISKED